MGQLQAWEIFSWKYFLSEWLTEACISERGRNKTSISFPRSKRSVLWESETGNQGDGCQSVSAPWRRSLCARPAVTFCVSAVLWVKEFLLVHLTAKSQLWAVLLPSHTAWQWGLDLKRWRPPSQCSEVLPELSCAALCRCQSSPQLSLGHMMDTSLAMASPVPSFASLEYSLQDPARWLFRPHPHHLDVCRLKLPWETGRVLKPPALVLKTHL